MTFAVFRPTAAELTATLPSFGGLAADALIYVWAIDHLVDAFLHDPLGLFDGRVFFPATDSLAYGDHMIGQAVLGLPLALLGAGPVLVFNLLALASYPLSATAMFVLAREHVGSLAAALAAGVVFAFTPSRFHSPQWLQVLFVAFMPLALLFWGRFVASGRFRDWLGWVLLWACHCLMGMYLAVFFTLILGVVGAFGLCAAPTDDRRRLVVGTLAAPLATGLLLLPTLLPYVRLRATQPFLREAGFDTPLDFLLPGPGTASAALFGFDGVHFGPGFVVVALCALGFWAALRAPGAWPRFFALSAILGLAASLCLTLLPADVPLAVPGFDMLRATSRAFFVSLIFIALFVSHGVAWLLARARSPRAAWALAVACLVALVLDMGGPPAERKAIPVGDQIPAVYEWLRELPGDPVVYERARGIEARALAQYYAGIHGKRLATGYNGFVSPGSEYVLRRLQTLPDPGSLALMDRLGIEYALLRFPAATDADRFVGSLSIDAVRVAARFGTDVVIEVAAVPERLAAAMPGRVLPHGDWRLTAVPAGGDPAAVIDGDADSAWAATIAAGDELYLEVDLGQVRLVDGVRARARFGREQDVFAARVSVSRDGQSWSRIGEYFEPADLDVLVERPRELSHFELRFDPQPARFLRLQSPETRFFGGSFELGEVMVLGPGDS